MRRISYFVVCLWLAACGRSHYEVLPKDAVILAFGDSLTAGVGATREQSYPTVLAQLSGRVVINAGVSGETTTEGRQRFPETLSQTGPQLIVLLEGGNDILRNQSQNTTKENLAAMITLAKSQGIPVLLLGVPEKSLFSDSAALYGELADEFSLLYMEDLVADLLRTPGLKSDAVHFNDAGYKKLAEGIFSDLKKQGLL